MRPRREKRGAASEVASAVTRAASAPRLSCPYCGLPVPSRAPWLGACVGHSDLPPLDPSRYLPDVLAAELGHALDVPPAIAAGGRSPPSRALQPRS